MPGIFLYILKLSISLVAVYAFYIMVLRRLTFYNWNRFYLLFYTLAAFIISAINITPVLERNTVLISDAIQFIPAVTDLTNTTQSALIKNETSFSFSAWDIVSIIVLMGVLVMLVRLGIQLFSFRKIIRRSNLVSGSPIKLFQVDRQIIPFSFGNSIFVNQQQHTAEELQEIIRHEFVHIKQKHSIDILWSEILCILNWYNPVVWMIRKSIRQNLEFIADDKVLQSGIDKLQYQYLLLKVTGNSHFSIASQFNFSSLKKRIAMMNKMKSARVHLLKFLFLLPLAAVLILSFRTVKKESVNLKASFTAAGIVYDTESMQPIGNVIISDKSNEMKAVSDRQGFFTIDVDAEKWQNKQITLSFSKSGYKESRGGFSFSENTQRSAIVLFGIPSVSSGINGSYVSNYSATDKNGSIIEKPGYTLVKEKFEQHFQSEMRSRKLDKLCEGNEKSIWIIDGIPYAIANGAKAWFTPEDLSESMEFKVMVDGKIMTMDEANRLVKRSDVVSVASMDRSVVKEKYGLDIKLLGLRTNKNPDGAYDSNATVLASSIPLPDTTPAGLNEKEYFISVYHRDDDGVITIKDKNRKEVRKVLLSEWNGNKSYYENLYGKLPEMVEAVKPVEANPDRPSKSEPTALAEPVEVVTSPVVSVNSKTETKVSTTVKTSPVKPEAAPSVSVKPEVAANVKTTVTATPSKVEEVVVVGKPGTNYKATETVTVVGHPTLASKVKTTVTTTPSKAEEVVVVGKPVANYKVPETVTVVGYPSSASEKEILGVIKSDMTEAELKQFEKKLNDRGFKFSITDVDYKDGKLAELKGELVRKNSRQTFTASGFTKMIIRDESKSKDSKEFGFVVDAGSLKVEGTEP